MMEYRKAVIEEADALAKLRVAFLSESSYLESVEEKSRLYAANLMYFRQSFADHSFMAWLAVEDGVIVGTSGLSVYRLPPNKKNPGGCEGYISNMYTLPEYRGHGIASKLFDLTVEEARQMGCGKLHLVATEMGRPIYEKYGFTDASHVMVYYT